MLLRRIRGKYGCETGQKLSKWIGKRLEKATGTANITFQQVQLKISFFLSRCSVMCLGGGAGHSCPLTTLPPADPYPPPIPLTHSRTLCCRACGGHNRECIFHNTLNRSLENQNVVFWFSGLRTFRERNLYPSDKCESTIDRILPREDDSVHARSYRGVHVPRHTRQGSIGFTQHSLIFPETQIFWWIYVNNPLSAAGIFQPVKYQEYSSRDRYVDGGLLCNYPIDCFDGMYTFQLASEHPTHVKHWCSFCRPTRQEIWRFHMEKVCPFSFVWSTVVSSEHASILTEKGTSQGSSKTMVRKNECPEKRKSLSEKLIPPRPFLVSWNYSSTSGM